MYKVGEKIEGVMMKIKFTKNAKGKPIKEITNWERPLTDGKTIEMRMRELKETKEPISVDREPIFSLRKEGAIS